MWREQRLIREAQHNTACVCLRSAGKGLGASMHFSFFLFFFVQQHEPNLHIMPCGSRMMKCELTPNQAQCPEGDRECVFLMPVVLSKGIKHLVKCLGVHFVVYLRRGERAHSHTRAEPPSVLTGCRVRRKLPARVFRRGRVRL